jgi:hypothetical protein
MTVRKEDLKWILDGNGEAGRRVIRVRFEG